MNNKEEKQQQKPLSRNALNVMAATAMMGTPHATFKHIAPPSGKREKGRSMRRIGTDDRGFDILKDGNGRAYTRDSRGTIRRFKPKK